MNVIVRPKKGINYLHLVQSVKIDGKYKVRLVSHLGRNVDTAIAKLKLQNLEKAEERRLISKIRNELAGRLQPICKTEEEINKASNQIKVRKKKTRQTERKEAIAAASQFYSAIGLLHGAPQIAEGETIQLGRHTLTCGDSSIWRPPAKGQMAFADPPYNAGVDKWDKDFIWQHDWLQAFVDFVIVTPGTSNLQSFLSSTSMQFHWLICCGLPGVHGRHSKIGTSNKIDALLFSSQASVHKGVSDYFTQSYSQSEKSISAHPGRKPIAFLTWLIEQWSKPNDVVIDPFLGSGTTLFAAEATNRICHGCELNRDYCQEVVDRRTFFHNRRDRQTQPSTL